MRNPLISFGSRGRTRTAGPVVNSNQSFVKDCVSYRYFSLSCSYCCFSCPKLPPQIEGFYDRLSTGCQKIGGVTRTHIEPEESMSVAKLF